MILLLKKYCDCFFKKQNTEQRRKRPLLHLCNDIDVDDY